MAPCLILPIKHVQLEEYASIDEQGILWEWLIKGRIGMDIMMESSVFKYMNILVFKLKS